jgi:hypothetical protein
MHNASRIALLGLALAVTLPPASDGQQPCLTKAWQDYNAQDYLNALHAAAQCIDDFGKQALREQQSLVDQRIPEPPTGRVSDREKTVIFARGILNDVGAAQFIKGRSAEYLLKSTKDPKYNTIARTGYEGAIALPYARVFDPGDFFWSPKQAATDRLADLPAVPARTSAGPKKR